MDDYYKLRIGRGQPPKGLFPPMLNEKRQQKQAGYKREWYASTNKTTARGKTRMESELPELSVRRRICGHSDHFGCRNGQSNIVLVNMCNKPIMRLSVRSCYANILIHTTHGDLMIGVIHE